MSKLFADFLEPDPETAWKLAGKPQEDPLVEARAKVVKSVDGALACLAAGEMEPKRGLYKIKADLAQVTIKAGRSILPIDGRDRNVIRADKLAAFFEAVKAAVEAGKLDKEITREAPDLRPESSRRAVWTPERKAEQAARLKASWAKRKAGA